MGFYTERQKQIVDFLKALQTNMILAFETLEPSCKFIRETWDHVGGGGGEMAVLRGDVFEKAAVNWSGVRGVSLPTGEEDEPFFATGVSLITHMKNPHAPTVHFNIRYIETTSKHWFGGGYDLTPMGISYEEDKHHFHDIAKKCLAPFGEDLYDDFSSQAKNYYYIKHWKKERGVGGIFFDHYNTGNFEKDLQMWKAVGNTFLEAILPIYNKRIPMASSEEDRKKQLQMRGHYAEFNLIYDRGTKFGFLSGGNPKAILCSMPPLACW